MRIVDRQTFLRLPAGTLYAKVDAPPSVGLFGDLCVKAETVGDDIDWWYWTVVGIEPPGDGDILHLIDAQEAMISNDASFPMEESLSRDGLFEAGQLFMIFEKPDLERLRSVVDAAISLSGR